MSGIVQSTWTLWGQRIKSRREQLGILQVDLAFAAQCDPTQLSRIERGVRGVSDSLKPRLAKALQMDPGDLFSYDEAATA